MWPNPQETADLVTFTEEILNGKPHFFCSVPSLDMILTDHHQVLMTIFSTFEEGKKLKQTEVEVNIMIKMKRHGLINLKFMLNWQTVLIKLWVILINRDTFWWQQRDFGLCETN